MKILGYAGVETVQGGWGMMVSMRPQARQVFDVAVGDSDGGPELQPNTSPCIKCP